MRKDWITCSTPLSQGWPIKVARSGLSAGFFLIKFKMSKFSTSTGPVEAFKIDLKKDPTWGRYQQSHAFHCWRHDQAVAGEAEMKKVFPLFTSPAIAAPGSQCIPKARRWPLFCSSLEVCEVSEASFKKLISNWVLFARISCYIDRCSEIYLGEGTRFCGSSKKAGPKLWARWAGSVNTKSLSGKQNQSPPKHTNHKWFLYTKDNLQNTKAYAIFNYTTWVACVYVVFGWTRFPCIKWHSPIMNHLKVLTQWSWTDYDEDAEHQPGGGIG